MRATRLSISVVIALATWAGDVVHAQNALHEICGAPPTYVPDELLNRTLPLRLGVGNSRESVTTKSPEAQAFYNQGLNYLESYVWIEASRSFQQALRLDPKLAMAYLGLSYVHSGLDNVAGASEYLTLAKALAAGVSDRERSRIDIREKHLAALADLKDAVRFLAYKRAIDDALAKYLEDPVFWILRANAEEVNASGRGQRGGASSVAFYQAVLAIVPEHATAHHSLVHSYETIGRIDKALEHGEAYARLSPSIPHAAHMWGHDLRRVGKVDEAIVQFKKTDELERAYYADEKLDPALDWHHAHNLDLLASCYQHKGQMTLAEATLRKSEALAVLSAYRAFNQRELANFLIQRKRYQEALIVALALSESKFVQGRCVGHALAGQALAALGRSAEARAQLELARKQLESVPIIANGLDPTHSMVKPWVDALAGELLLRAGKNEDGRKLLKEVIKALRTAVGPDAWSQGLFRLEAMARNAIAAKDWEFAEYVANQMLEHDAAYGGSRYSMALVLAHKGDSTGALRELQLARHYWLDADSDLPERKAMDELARQLRGGKQK
jgi:tetratricopeptide (TPR) repeat protein